MADGDGLSPARAVADRMNAVFQNEFADTDPGATVAVARLDRSAAYALTPEDTQNVLRLLLLSPQGVQTMSREFPGLARTSLNLGSLSLSETELRFGCLVRSALDSEKTMLVRRLTALAETLGCSIDLTGNYAAWEYRRHSPIRALTAEAFAALYEREPEVTATHCGLECGLFCGKRPGLDVISFGPDIPDIHSPRERVSVSSVARTFALLCEVLRRSR